MGNRRTCNQLGPLIAQNADQWATQEYLTRYNEHVARVVPPERLFWMEMSEGWAPLCKMLDKPIPEEPFPRANDSEAADELIELKIKAACLAWTGILGAVGLAAWVGLRAFKISRRY